MSTSLRPADEKKPSISSGLDVLAKLFAVSGVLYALGFAVFRYQLWRTFSTDISTALYATALVPQTVILGQSIRLIIVSYKEMVGAIGAYLIGIWFLPSPAAFQQQLEEANDSSLKKHDKGAKPPMRTGPKAWLIRLASWVPVVFVVLFGIFPVGMNLYNQEWSGAGFNLLRLGIGVVTGITILIMLAEGYSLLWRLIIPVTVLYVGITFSAFARGELDNPPLPNVELYRSGSTLVGRLVAHKDGYWYVFTEPEHKLTAMPDAGITDVVISTQ